MSYFKALTSWLLQNPFSCLFLWGLYLIVRRFKIGQTTIIVFRGKRAFSSEAADSEVCLARLGQRRGVNPRVIGLGHKRDAVPRFSYFMMKDF